MAGAEPAPGGPLHNTLGCGWHAPPHVSERPVQGGGAAVRAAATCLDRPPCRPGVLSVLHCAIYCTACVPQVLRVSSQVQPHRGGPPAVRPHPFSHPAFLHLPARPLASPPACLPDPPRSQLAACRRMPAPGCCTQPAGLNQPPACLLPAARSQRPAGVSAERAPSGSSGVRARALLQVCPLHECVALMPPAQQAAQLTR